MSREICASRITKNIFLKSRFSVNEMIWSRITKISLYDPLKTVALRPLVVKIIHSRLEISGILPGYKVYSSEKAKTRKSLIPEQKFTGK